MIGAKKILRARRVGKLDFPDLKKMGIVLKRAQYFITCKGKSVLGIQYNPESVLRGLLSDQSWELAGPPMEQLSLFEDIDVQGIIGNDFLTSGTGASGSGYDLAGNVKQPALEAGQLGTENHYNPGSRFMKGELVKCLTGQI